MPSFDIPSGKKSKYTKLLNMAKYGTGPEKENAQKKLKNLFINLPKV